MASSSKKSKQPESPKLVKIDGKIQTFVSERQFRKLLENNDAILRNTKSSEIVESLVFLQDDVDYTMERRGGISILIELDGCTVRHKISSQEDLDILLKMLGAFAFRMKDDHAETPMTIRKFKDLHENMKYEVLGVGRNLEARVASLEAYNKALDKAREIIITKAAKRAWIGENEAEVIHAQEFKSPNSKEVRVELDGAVIEEQEVLVVEAKQTIKRQHIQDLKTKFEMIKKYEDSSTSKFKTKELHGCLGGLRVNGSEEEFIKECTSNKIKLLLPSGEEFSFLN